MAEVYEDFSSLLRAVQDVWNGHYDLDRFSTNIRRYIASVACPLEQKQDANDRSEVQSGKISLSTAVDNTLTTGTISVTEPYRKMFLRFSDNTGLNEKHTVRLFLHARSKTARTANYHEELQRTALEILHARRMNLLTAISDLVEMIGNPGDFPESVNRTVQEFFKDLKHNSQLTSSADDFVSNTLVLLRQLIERNVKFPIFEATRSRELGLVSKILMSICRHMDISFERVADIVKLMDRCAEGVGKLSKDDDHKHEVQRLKLVYHDLLLAIIIFLQRQRDLYGNSSTEQERLDTSRYGELFSRSAATEALFPLRVVWAVHMLGVAAIAPVIVDAQEQSELFGQLRTELGLTSRSRDPSQSNTDREKVFWHLSVFLTKSPFLRQTHTRSVAARVVGMFLSDFLLYADRLVLAMRERAQKQMMAEQENLQDIEIPVNNFNGLLGCIATVCRMQPVIADLFWEQNHAQLQAVIQPTLADKLVTLVPVIEGLCATSSGALHSYNTFLSSKALLSFPKIFGHLRVLIDNQARAPMMGRGFPRQHNARREKLVAALLKLVQAVTHSPSVQRTLHGEINDMLGRHQQNRHIDLLFELFHCNLAIKTKAEVMKTVCALVVDNPDVCWSVWSKMDEVLMPQQRGHGRIDPTTNGFLYDIEQFEKPSEHYPLTVAFCHLIMELMYLRSTPPRDDHQNKTEIEPAQFSKYVTFVKDQVFKQLDGRKYREEHERWRLSEISLSIFGMLVDEFDPAEGPYEHRIDSDIVETVQALMMRQMCTDGFFFRKILELLQRSFQRFDQLNTSDADVSPNDADSILREKETTSVVATLMLSIKLIASAIEKEETFIANMRRGRSFLSSSLCSVTDMLLKHPAAVMCIAKSIAIRQYPLSTTLNDDPQKTFAVTSGHGQLSYYASLVMRYLSAKDSKLLVAMIVSQNERTNIISAYADQLRHVQAALPTEPSSEDAAERDDDVGMANRSVLNDDSVSFVQGTPFQINKTFLTPASALSRAPIQEHSMFAQDQPQPETPVHVAEDLENDFNHKCRVTILESLIENLRSSSGRDPFNLAHLLLGFDRTSIQRTDLVSAPREVLDELLVLAQRQDFAAQYPVLAEQCFELFYRLLSDDHTSQPFLQFLRTSTLAGEMFFFRLLGSLPGEVHFSEQFAPTFLRHQYWLMRSISLQLHLMFMRVESTSYFLQQALNELGFLSSSTLAYSSVADTLSYRPTLNSSDYESKEDNSLRIFSLLQRIETLSQYSPEPGFTASSIGGISIDEFKYHDSPSTFSYNLVAMWKAGCRAKMNQTKLAEICENARKWNEHSVMLLSCLDAVNSFKEMVEVLLYEIFDTHLDQDPDQYAEVLLKLLVMLLSKLTAQNSSTSVWLLFPALSEPLASVALTVMGKLRECGRTNTTLRGSQTPAVLELLMQGILTSEKFGTRAFLYASFHYYMKSLHESAEVQQTPSVTSMFDSAVQFQDEKVAFSSSVSELLHAYCSRVVNIVAKDAIDLNARLRPLAFIFLHSILTFSRSLHSKCLKELKSQNAVGQYLNEITSRNRALEAALEGNDHRRYAEIVKFDSLMSTLVLIAHTQEGADILDQAGCLQTLTACSFLKNQYFNSHANPAANSILPSVTQRYLELLTPTLRLVVAMSTSLPNNFSLQRKIAAFMMEHDSAVDAVLQRVETCLGTQKTMRDFLVGDEEYGTDTLLQMFGAGKLILDIYHFLFAATALRPDADMGDLSPHAGIVHRQVKWLRKQVKWLHLLPKLGNFDLDDVLDAESNSEPMDIEGDVPETKKQTESFRDTFRRTLDELTQSLVGIAQRICSIDNERPFTQSFSMPSKHNLDLGLLVALSMRQADITDSALDEEKKCLALLERIKTDQVVDADELKNVDIILPQTVDSSRKSLMAYKLLVAKLDQTVDSIHRSFYIVETATYVLEQHMTTYLKSNTRELSENLQQFIPPLLEKLRRLKSTLQGEHQIQPQSSISPNFIKRLYHSLSRLLPSTPYR